MIAAAVLAQAPALAAPPIVPLPGTDGCVSEDGSGGLCADVHGLDGAYGVAVSPDGISLYVTSITLDVGSEGYALSIFDRAPATGALTQLGGTAGCFSSTVGSGLCTVGRSLVGAAGIAVSPDGGNVYVAAADEDGGVAVFDRNRTTGALTQKAGTDGCINDDGGEGCATGVALNQPAGVAVSPDGRNVYVVAPSGSSVAIFDRDPTDGTLTQKGGTAGCVSETGDNSSCQDGLALEGPIEVVVSPDGRNVYVSTLLSEGVATFDRDPATGELTQKGGLAACITDDGTGGSCRDHVALAGARGLAVSPDGRNVYVAAVDADAVAALQRNRTTGELTSMLGTSTCWSETGTDGSCHDGVGLTGALAVAVSADGTSVYVAGSNGYDVAVFDRTTAISTFTGALEQKSSPAGCWSDDGSSGACSVFAPLEITTGVTVSPDGRNVYQAALGSDAVAVFARYAVAYDVDGDGEVEALTDGLLLLRYLFGFTGSTLTAGAVDLANCTRCDAASIEAYIAALYTP